MTFDIATLMSRVESGSPKDIMVSANASGVVNSVVQGSTIVTMKLKSTTIGAGYQDSFHLY